MPIKGKLLHILLELHNNATSAVVRVEKGAEKKQLVVNKGLLVFAESNVPDEHLARIAVKQNILPRTGIKEIASLMKGGKTSEEAFLAVSNSGEHDLENARREQAIIILASLLSWENCAIHLYPSDSLVRYKIHLGLSLLEALVLSARRSISERFIRIPSGFAEKTLCRTAEASASPPDYPLNKAEARAWALLEKPMKAEDLYPLLSDADAKPEEILLRLLVLGLIHTAEPSPVRHGPSVALEQDSALRILEDMLAGFKTASLYEILSISPEASSDEVQAAYHQLARQYHPDRFQSAAFSEETRAKAEQVFACINRAYFTLKDPVFRADYDEKRLSSESKVEAELKSRGTAQSDDEKTAEAIYREGRALLKCGDFEKAVEHLKACVWLAPEKAKFNHYLGVAESKIPKLRKSAEQHLLKALELDSTSIASRLELARLYIKVGLRRKAEAQLRELVQWDPHNREVQKLAEEIKNMETS